MVETRARAREKKKVPRFRRDYSTRGNRNMIPGPLERAEDLGRSKGPLY